MKKKFPPVQEQLAVLSRGVAEIISEEELALKLERSRSSGQPLRIKWGVDPTAPDIHLGHAVVLRKMKQFQDLGHEVILLIGDFTGQVGDPSGRDQTRMQLQVEQVQENARTYIEQVQKVLDPEKMVVDFNSRWLAGLTFGDVVGLASTVTVARMLERDDFATRFQKQRAIYLHEFFYPLMQGYDSVALKADVELGGTEQKFNILTARDVQRVYDQEVEVAVLMPILEGTCGVRRMSKSTGNYIGIDEDPDTMYGKTMSVPDDIMLRYFELVSTLSPEEISNIKSGLTSGSVHPRDAKMMLARNIVSQYHDAGAAKQAEENFARVFQRGEMPVDMDEVRLSPDDRIELGDGGKVRVSRLLVRLGLAKSNSEARRFITGGGVRVDGSKVANIDAELTLATGMVISVGKRSLAKVVLE